MYEIRECKQRTARENHICDFCLKWIKKGSEYMAYKGLDDNGWFSKKLHIHCDAINNYYASKDTLGGHCSANDAFRFMFFQACEGCKTRPYCYVFQEKDLSLIATCERAVTAILPEGPIRNAALQSIKATKERPHYHD